MRYALNFLEKYTIEQLNQAFHLYEGLMNIAFAATSTQDRILTTQIEKPYFDEHKTGIVLNTVYSRSFGRMEHKLKHMQQEPEALWNTYYAWKEALALALKKEGYTLSLKKRKSLQRSLIMGDYRLFYDFHYGISTNMPDSNELFDMKNFVFDVANYLLCLDTLNDGFGSDSFNTLARSVLNQPDSFFEDGYCLDFFVHDRFARHLDKDQRYIVSYKERLSTHIYSTIEQAKNMMDCKYQFLLTI